MNDFFRIDADADTGVAELVLNRPDRMNTMAPAFFPALRDAVQALDDAGATRALIVRGEGKHFSAGVALDTFAPDGAMQRLQRLLPQGLARELAYTGDRLGAERALATGFVNAVVADGDALLAHARKLAAAIAGKSPLAVAASKIALNHARDHSTADALQQMTLLQSAVFDIDEMARVIAAWQARKPAVFDPLGEIAKP